VLPRTLIRRKRSPSQGRLSRSRRVANLRGAFRVQPCAKEKLTGRRVLLIDDVPTTGATVTAYTKTLRRAGATQVDVLTLARVVRDRS
jgi:predicted amidophosphoribosyltransferase